MAAAKRKPRSKPKVDLAARGARVVSVFGPFASRTLIEMSTETAAGMFPEPLGASGRTNVVTAVEQDIAAIRKRAPELADSALAASAVALAYEMEHPYNSATSKSMCARELRAALEELRELAPPEQEKDGIDRITGDRRLRLAGGTATPRKAGA